MYVCNEGVNCYTQAFLHQGDVGIHVNTRHHNKHVCFMLAINNLSNLEANLHACFYQEQDGRNLSNDCGTVCLFFSSSYLLGHVYLKYHFPSNSNMVDSFAVAVNRKISPFFHT